MGHFSIVKSPKTPPLLFPPQENQHNSLFLCAAHIRLLQLTEFAEWSMTTDAIREYSVYSSLSFFRSHLVAWDASGNELWREEEGWGGERIFFSPTEPLSEKKRMLPIHFRYNTCFSVFQTMPILHRNKQPTILLTLKWYSKWEIRHVYTTRWLFGGYRLLWGQDVQTAKAAQLTSRLNKIF